MTAWLFEKRRFETPHLNMIERFNEFTNLVISIMLLVQNNNRGGDDLYEMGNMVNMTIIAMFLINVIFVLINVSKEYFL